MNTSNVKRRIFLSGAAAAFLLFIGSSAWPQASIPEDPTKGARLFVSKGCVKCHAFRGEGGTAGPDFGRIDLGNTLLDLSSKILNHIPPMTQGMERMKMLRPTLSGDEITDICAYLYFLKFFDEPGNPARGKYLFDEKGCGRCHPLTGKGKEGEPGLDQFPQNITPVYLAEMIWNHGSVMIAEMVKLGMKWPTFEGTEMMDLLEYIRSNARGPREAAFVTPGNPREGRKTFAQKGCINCHAVYGEGGKGPFYIAASILLAITCWAVYAYLNQYRRGLGITGLVRPIFWGVYITDFVFFIGISHAGTLISAILRLAKAEWRRSITRSAEVITVLVLFFGVGNILIDLGRPDRALNIILHPQFRSPLLWDVSSITVYLTASSIYLFLPLIPDIALLRDYGGKWKWFYRILALGWTGTERQHRLLERAIAVMAILVIPIAISVHTVVSFVFAMTIQPMWHSAIFGPYFVAGAIFSGIAALIVAMNVIRKVYHLEDYLRPIHFNYLGILLLVMTLLWFYFTFAEYITVYYGHEPLHMEIFWSKLTGPFALYFWGMVFFCFVIPLPILSVRKLRTPVGTLVASISVIIGMWLERFVIVVPTLTHPRLPNEAVTYLPTWVEWSVLAGSISFFIFIYMVFTKVFPIVSIWEVREGREKSVAEVKERVSTYLPGISVE